MFLILKKYLNFDCIQSNYRKTKFFSIYKITFSFLNNSFFFLSKLKTTFKSELIRKSFKDKNIIFSLGSRNLCFSIRFILRPISIKMQSMKYLNIKCFN